MKPGAKPAPLASPESSGRRRDLRQCASDGVVAPLLFMELGGAPADMMYKAVNTLDSMVGYRNERYLDFGRFAARLMQASGIIALTLSRLAALIAESR